jgi:hypothetical protein
LAIEREALILPASFYRNENLIRALLRRFSQRRRGMGFGRGALLWLLGVPIPVIILLALFWHH